MVLLLALSGRATAQSDGGYASPFTLGAGARDLALSGANLAQGDFATAAYWNASRLARAQRYTVAAFHSRLYDSDVAYQYVGVVVPTMDIGTFGLGIMRLGIGGIDARDPSNISLGEISDNRFRVYLAYGSRLSGFDVGLAAAIENHSIGDVKATSSPGLDLSASRRLEPGSAAVDHVTVALQLRHLIKPSIKLLDASTSQPLELNLGVSTQLRPRPAGPYAITLAASLTKVENVNPFVAAGVELDIQELLQIRGGIRAGKASVGAGLSVRGIAFDYALVNRDLDVLHMFSLTTSFGRSVSERRQKRELKREADFNNQMQNQLARRNEEMIVQQVARGDELLQAGEVADALARFERALFLARHAGTDTTSIGDRANRARDLLEQKTREENLVINLDSAQSRLQAGDYVGTRYFAGVVLGIDPSSVRALQMLEQANLALTESAAREEAVRDGLVTVDSLLSYGRTETAWERVQALTQIAPKDPTVQSARTRTRFEWWRSRASAASADGDGPAALAALDSALQLYPGHQWCMDMRARTEASLAKPRVSAPVEAAGPAQLSAELEARVKVLYSDAAEAFERGDLNTAIEDWQEVERLAPDYASVRSYLVRAYKFVGVELYGQDELDLALDAWGKAAELEPHNDEITGYMRRAKNELRKLRELSYDSR